jgi:hypothetical protein
LDGKQFGNRIKAISFMIQYSKIPPESSGGWLIKTRVQAVQIAVFQLQLTF